MNWKQTLYAILLRSVTQPRSHGLSSRDPGNEVERKLERPCVSDEYLTIIKNWVIV